MLTNAVAKAAGAQSRAYKLHDQGGMHLLVRPTGTKSWQLKYRWQGREKLLTLGQFPDIPVPRARILQAEAKDMLSRLVDPANMSKKSQNVDMFEVIARDWHRHNVSRWSECHAADVLAQMQADVFGAIGSSAIGELDSAQLLELVRKVEARGAVEAAGRLRQRLSAIFSYAMALGKVETDPAAHLGRAMAAKGISIPHAALTNIEACRQLLADCEVLPAQVSTVLASRFLALTAVRLDAVRGARWEEIEGLGGAEPIWRVPAARMKMSRAKKNEQRYDHFVPLAPAAVELLRQIMGGCGPQAKSGLVFPGRGENSPIGHGAIRDLYVRAGFAGRHVPHGWRASFSTILNEQLGDEWGGAIELALAHSKKDKVEAAYNRAQKLGRRRELLEHWSTILTD